jgi:hypothetical protein
MKAIIEITIQYAGEILTAGVALIVRAIEKKLIRKKSKQNSSD